MSITCVIGLFGDTNHSLRTHTKKVRYSARHVPDFQCSRFNIALQLALLLGTIGMWTEAHFNIQLLILLKSHNVRCGGGTFVMANG